MALLKREVLLIGLALVFGACTGPQPKHRDSGSTDTPTATDGSGIDAPADLPTTSDADGSMGADKPMVVVAPPGSVANGKPCSKNDDCQSTFCRDDVCCNDSCEGTCYACSSTYTNQDNGTCAFVVAGADPRGVCTDESAAKACGQDGTCDGKGACRKQG
ncbi:MAG TPA: hypothetical protein VMU50_04800, partial [Polyangia bacterium]|nr:hypothetical protein [Polyangia bacterium]